MNILERFDSLTAREKLIVLATLIIALWGIWDNLIYTPLSNRLNKAETQLKSLNIQLPALNNATLQIKQAGTIDPDQKVLETLGQVKEQLQKLEQQINSGTGEFVPAHLMTDLLKQLLKEHSGLKLLKMETLPTEPYTQTKIGKHWIYKHPLQIELQGNFFDTLSYLQSLQSIQLRLNWESINYQVAEYPYAKTELKLYTLSFEENWLGL
jgi:MSHA biogenesis protein MshJ